METLGELLEAYGASHTMVISSQATEETAVEGSETRSRAKAVMDPRVPSPSVRVKI